MPAGTLSALCAESNQALGALMAEIHRSGRAMKVLAAMATDPSCHPWPSLSDLTDDPKLGKDMS
jgi:hypothetical protein